jgi:hypothetical protein
MKVHTLDIDSGERDTELYECANNYNITLKTIIYNITKLEVISTRLPKPRLFNHFNNKFTIHDDNGTYNAEIDPLNVSLINNPSKSTVATYLQDTVIPSTGCTTIDQVSYTNGRFEFSNTLTTSDFNLDFYNGVDGWTSNVISRTTPNQIFGLSSSNVMSSSGIIRCGQPDISFAPKTFVLKISSGSDDFNQDSYTNTPFYTGVFMNNETDATQEYLTFYSQDDLFVHEYNNGPQKQISNLKIEWYSKENNKLIPIDFKERDHAIKLRIHGSTDKLINLPQNQEETIHEETIHEKSKINIPEIVENVYIWKEYIYIGVIILIGLILTLFMKKKPKITG